MSFADPMAWFEQFCTWLVTKTTDGISSAASRAGDAAGRPLSGMHTSRLTRKEVAELKQLLKQLQPYRSRAEDTCQAVCRQAVTDWQTTEQAEAAANLCWQLLSNEEYYPLEEPDLSIPLPLPKVWEFINSTRRQLQFYKNPARQQEIAQTLTLFLNNLLSERLPQRLAEEGGGKSLSVPLINLHPNPAQPVQAVLAITFQKPQDDDSFSHLAKTLERNLALASGVDPARLNQSDKEPVFPAQATHKTPADLVHTYLAGTPFPQLLNTPVSFTIPLQARFEHMHVVGGSGHGKTQLLQSFILSDLPQVQAGTRSLVVIDSQGDLLRNISQLECLREMGERVVIIDPTDDVENPPALNLFDFGLDRLSRYSALERETLVNGAIALYEYVFGALLGAELTQRQGVIFRYLARLMMVVPDATIHDLMDFMIEPDAVRPHIPNLKDPLSRKFFETQFFSTAFNETRQQILTRLWGVLSNPVLARMFGNKRNKVNLYTAMNRGSLILINTAKDLLKQEGCEVLGRFFIALICQAAQERSTIPQERRIPTFVYIDEAHDYFDESMENLFNQARKYLVGLVVAHQNLDQFEQKLRATVMASTSIKMVGGLSARDADAFAREMGCEPEFFQGIRKLEKEKLTQFACTVRNYTPRPMCLTVPLGEMSREPTLSGEELTALKAANRARYGSGAETNSTQDIRSPEDTPPEDPELL